MSEVTMPRLSDTMQEGTHDCFERRGEGTWQLHTIMSQ